MGNIWATHNKFLDRERLNKDYYFYILLGKIYCDVSFVTLVPVFSIAICTNVYIIHVHNFFFILIIIIIIKIHYT